MAHIHYMYIHPRTVLYMPHQLESVEFVRPLIVRMSHGFFTFGSALASLFLSLGQYFIISLCGV